VTPARLAAMPGPIFVGGCPRSGTTMLRTMLNSHPELAVPHETLFLVDGYRMRGRWGCMEDPENRRRLAEWVVARPEARTRRLARRPKRLVRRMVKADPTLGSVLSAGFRLYADRKDKPRWGDKRPSYAMNLDALFAMFPDALYVNVVRDPRAAVASIRKVGEGRRGWYADPVVAGTDLWQRSQRNAHRLGRRLPAQFFEVQYEELVADPEPVLAQLVDFLELDPAGVADMLAFHERADIKAEKMHPLVAKPVTTEAVRKWEKQLAREEIAFVERTLSGDMAVYGYEPVAAGVAIPSDFDKRLRARRNYMRRQLTRLWLAERYRRLTYRHPVAARTS
jgi:hypothetical protein